MTARLEHAGIKIIGQWKSMGENGEGHYRIVVDGKDIQGAWLEYEGKRIRRPDHVQRTPDIVYREFGVKI